MKIVTCPKCFKKMKIEEECKLFLCPHCQEKISIEDVAAEPEAPAENEVPAEIEAPVENAYQESTKGKNKKVIIAVAVALVAVVAGAVFFLLPGKSESKEQVEDKKEDRKEVAEGKKKEAKVEVKKEEKKEAKKEKEEILVPYYDEESELYGYCTIDEAYAFDENGLARVGIKSGWSSDYHYINEKGEIIQPKN